MKDSEQKSHKGIYLFLKCLCEKTLRIVPRTDVDAANKIRESKEGLEQDKLEQDRRMGKIRMVDNLGGWFLGCLVIGFVFVIVCFFFLMVLAMSGGGN